MEKEKKRLNPNYTNYLNYILYARKKYVIRLMYGIISYIYVLYEYTYNKRTHNIYILYICVNYCIIHLCSHDKKKKVISQLY